MKIKHTLVVLLLALYSTQGLTALVSQDSAFGTGSITLDTDSGYKWLDLTYSTPYSYLSIQAELGSGGLFEGFRIATRDEVSGLFSDAGIPTLSSLNFYPENYDPVKNLMSYVGITGTDGNLGTGIPFDYSVGHTADLYPTPGWVWVGGLAVYEPDKTGRASVSSYVPVDNNNDKHGTWLIVDAPEPASLALMGLGLAGMGLIHRRRLKGSG